MISLLFITFSLYFLYILFHMIFTDSKHVEDKLFFLVIDL